MTRALVSLALVLAVCLLVVWLLVLSHNIVLVPFGLALGGLLSAKPLLELSFAIRHEMRRAVWYDVQGRYFSFRGRAVHVLEGEDHQRWIRLSDIRAIAGFPASEAALQLTYPNGWRLCGRPASPHLSDEALLAHLAKERAPAAAKLRHWVEREIVFPARRQRDRQGVRLEAPDFRASD